MPEKSKESSKNKFELVEITTETAKVYQDMETDEQFSGDQALLKLLNDVTELKRQLIG